MTCLEEKENMLTFHLQQFSKKNRPLSPFVSKLRFLLNSSKYHHAIHWSSDGRAIVITDIDSFKHSVLENKEEMFKTRNFTSFVRQLNLYGFRKIPSNGKSDPMSNMKFEHIHFRRERPDLMHLVHRTCLSGRKKLDLSSPSKCVLPKQKMAPLKHPKINSITEDIENTSARVKIQMPCKSTIDIKPQRLPLGLSLLQNLKRKHEQNFTIVHEIPDQSFEDSFVDFSLESLESSICEHDISTNENNSSCAKSVNEIVVSPDEHDYALPVYQMTEMDEKANFEFLNENFNVEIDVVRALLSMKSRLPVHTESNLDALSTLAEVSLKFSSSDMSEENSSVRNQSESTPRETLNQF